MLFEPADDDSVLGFLDALVHGDGSLEPTVELSAHAEVLSKPITVVNPNKIGNNNNAAAADGDQEQYSLRNRYRWNNEGGVLEEAG